MILHRVRSYCSARWRAKAKPVPSLPLILGVREALQACALSTILIVSSMAAVADEKQIPVSDEGIEISNHLTSLLYPGGRIRLDDRDFRKIFRWESPIRIWPWIEHRNRDIADTVSETLSDVAQFMEQAGTPTIMVTPDSKDASVVVLVRDDSTESTLDLTQVEQRFIHAWPGAAPLFEDAPQTGCHASVTLDARSAIQLAVVVIKRSLATPELKQCLVREMGAIMGFPGEPDHNVHTSMFSRDPKLSGFSPYDLGALRILYSPQWSPGMSYQEAFSHVFRLSQRAALEVFPQDQLHWTLLPKSMFENQNQ